MPRAQSALDWTPTLYRKAAGTEGPEVWTRPERRDGTRPADVVPGPVEPVGFLFEETFDDQPDFDPTINSVDMSRSQFFADEGDTIPTGWDAVRSTPGWSPSRGYENGKESLYIKGGNQYTRSGTGKAFVAYRFGRNSSAFWGDSILAKTFTGKTELFARFWIKFQPGWARRGQSKIFRVQSWAGRDKNNFWNSSDIWPAMIWGFEHTSFGTRNKISLRNSPNHTTWPSSFASTLPRSLVDGDLPLHYLNDPPQPVTFPDLVNGGSLSGDPDHAQMFGDVWHKFEFHIKMNSAPGEPDGVLTQWKDDQLLFDNRQIPWMLSDSPPGRTWDIVKIGGNDSWNRNDDGTDITESETPTNWYAIDEIQIYDSLPEDML